MEENVQKDGDLFKLKATSMFNTINLIEKSIKDGIDTIVENSEVPITLTEINSALLNVLKKFNQTEIMEIIKNESI